MLKEIFKTIPHYPKYEVSNLGRIRNKMKGNIMNWIDNGKGYKLVKLYNETKPSGRMCLVHRIVLSTFNPTDNPDLDVNHKDGDKSNNKLDNLEWLTKSENTRHAHLTGLFKSRNKLTIDQVKEIKCLVKLANRQTNAEIASKYGVRPMAVSDIANGRLYKYV